MNILQAILHFLQEIFLGCRHDRLTRPFTIKQQTYKVCLDCGKHVYYSAVTMQPLSRREVKRMQAILSSEVKLIPATDSTHLLTEKSGSRAVA